MQKLSRTKSRADQLLTKFITWVLYAGPISGGVFGIIVGFKESGWQGAGEGVIVMGVIGGAVGLLAAAVLHVVLRLTIVLVEKVSGYLS